MNHLSSLTERQKTRFWSKVDSSNGKDQCWPWTGATNPRGYGTWTIHLGGGRTTSVRPHRVAWVLTHGPLSDGMTIDHLCHNRDLSCPGGNDCPHRQCCNPDHLDPATHRVNMGRVAATRGAYGASLQLRQRRDGTTAYRVLFRRDKRQTSETFNTREAAEEFIRLCGEVGTEAAIRVRDARDESAPSVPTLAEWLEHHLAHSPGITDGTKAEYRRLARRSWLPVLGELPVDAIDRDAIARWIERQKRTVTSRGKPTSAKSIANMHGLLSTVLSSAAEARHIGANPAKGMGLPKGAQEEMVFLTHDEYAAVLAHIPEHWKPLIVTLAGTGLRWGEITALRWSEVDIDSPRPSVRVIRAWKHGETQRVIGIPKTSRSRRTIALPPEVVDVLRPLRTDDTRHDDIVFRGPRSGLVHHQSFRRVWHAAVAKSGIGKKPRVHDLRHSHASWLIAAGRPLPRIQRRLGHESIKTTVDTYGHLSDDDIDGDLAALSEALTQALPELLDEPEQLPDARTEIIDGPQVQIEA